MSAWVRWAASRQDLVGFIYGLDEVSLLAYLLGALAGTVHPGLAVLVLLSLVTGRWAFVYYAMYLEED